MVSIRKDDNSSVIRHKSGRSCAPKISHELLNDFGASQNKRERALQKGSVTVAIWGKESPFSY